MKFKDIVAVGGKPGLYKIIVNTKNHLIVESLQDKKRMPVFSHQRISVLEAVSIYTKDGDMPLKEAFRFVYEKKQGKIELPPKTTKEQLKSIMDEILPMWDKERVHPNDIKKFIQWYNILLENGFDFLAEEEEEVTNSNETSPSNENKS